MKNRKIIIIDKDKEFLGKMKKIVTAIGYILVMVNDALSAVDTVIRSKPDLIILELKMPRLNGFELAREMNRVFDTEKIPIIAMSSLFRNNPSSLMNLCGIQKYLRKPCHPLDVIWAIENVTDNVNNQLKEEKCLERVGYQNYDMAQRLY